VLRSRSSIEQLYSILVEPEPQIDMAPAPTLPNKSFSPFPFAIRIFNFQLQGKFDKTSTY
jgi:hypothetical protein